jgi:hypothetical protein
VENVLGMALLSHHKTNVINSQSIYLVQIGIDRDGLGSIHCVLGYLVLFVSL